MFWNKKEEETKLIFDLQILALQYYNCQYSNEDMADAVFSQLKKDISNKNNDELISVDGKCLFYKKDFRHAYINIVRINKKEWDERSIPANKKWTEEIEVENIENDDICNR